MKAYKNKTAKRSAEISSQRAFTEPWLDVIVGKDIPQYHDNHQLTEKKPREKKPQ